MKTDLIPSLAHLSNDDLLAQAKRLAQCEREAMANLIAHLAEIGARRLYRREGCASLFTYCTERLGFSESAAYRRIQAARAARRFPLILDLLAQGSIHLTAVKLLAKHLTPDNHRELLEEARGKSRLQVEELVARVAPRPAVPAMIRKMPQPQPVPPPKATAATPPPPVLEMQPVAPRPAVVQPLAPEIYRVQFTMSREMRDRLRQVQDLMRHRVPNGDLAQVFDAALTLLLEKLERDKLGKTSRPRPSRGTAASRHIPAQVRREVHARDGLRCTYVSPDGHRCTETGMLEFEHRQPHGAGGAATTENITFLCRSHNQYRAEEFYGPPEVRETAARYEPNSLLERVRGFRAAEGSARWCGPPRARRSAGWARRCNRSRPSGERHPVEAALAGAGVACWARGGEQQAGERGLHGYFLR